MSTVPDCAKQFLIWRSKYCITENGVVFPDLSLENLCLFRRKFNVLKDDRDLFYELWVVPDFQVEKYCNSSCQVAISVLGVSAATQRCLLAGGMLRRAFPIRGLTNLYKCNVGCYKNSGARSWPGLQRHWTFPTPTIPFFSL